MRRFSPQKMAEILARPEINLTGLAKAISASRQTVHNLKNGQIADPSINLIVGIADVLRVDISLFFDGDVSPGLQETA